MNTDTEFQNWQRRDVAIDFICAVIIMCGGAFLIGCLL